LPSALADLCAYATWTARRIVAAALCALTFASAVRSIRPGATGTTPEALGMEVIVLFVLFAVILDGIAVGICTLIESYSEHISLLAFLGFFVLNFIIAWQLALRVTERYLVSETRRKANEEHTRWVNSLYVRVRR
jgi:hypothetical protein